ncbi:SDR family oxidoreductase [Echinicola shivajiensis]|uniref:SDR family oxidoreductase n=1 Tax=Echinicola shivajiensis TaxID=1035916 RepID=UPI001BFC648F|nr:SDR family oxidoreductase [Echinicola shivajiensis]
MYESLKNKTTLVTGGNTGIGHATAKALVKTGANVAISDIVENQETKDLVKNSNGKIIFINCDVSNDQQVKEMINKTIATFGQLDYSFNNAGTEGLTAPTHECSLANWEKVINTNLKGVWLCMKYEIEQMIKKGKGAIVNNSSIAGLVGFANIPAYTASKHGVLGLTKTAALEYAKEGIRVNAVCPGVIKTPMIDRFTGNDNKVLKEFENMEPVGRIGKAQEIAEAVLWLLSDKSSFVTGHAMAVDGGWVAQ